jgi:hypothetical protein
MKPIGIVILYDRKEGAPEELSTKFVGDFFAQITENLVKERTLDIGDIKEVLDSKQLFFGGIRESFNDFVDNPEGLGKIAWKVFNNHTGKEPIDDVKMVIFDGEKVPWKHTIAACVVYDNN